jgi:predicted N-acetyltransferase YhbS
MDIEIRNLVLEDIPEADRLMNLAFNSLGSRASELQRFITVAPEGWLAAWQDGELVAMGGAIDYGNFAWIGLMAVRPERQRQGLGNLLMGRLLAWLDGRGCPMARLDASVAGEGLYRKFGCVDAGQALVFLKPEYDRTKMVPYGNSAGIRPMQAADLPEVVELDQQIVGARRESLLSIYRSDFPERSFVARSRSGKIVGYLVAQWQKIGPWACADPAAAETLLQTALSLPYEDVPQAIVPVENEHARQVLTQAGFMEGRPHLHMRRGGDHLPGQRQRLYGQASYAVG